MLIGLYKSFKLNVQVSVLALKNIAMRIQSVEFRLKVTVSFQNVVVAESEVVLLLSGDHELILNLSMSLFSFVELTLEVSVFGILIFSLTLKIGLVSELAIEVSLKSLRLDHKS